MDAEHSTGKNLIVTQLLAVLRYVQSVWLASRSGNALAGTVATLLVADINHASKLVHKIRSRLPQCRALMAGCTDAPQAPTAGWCRGVRFAPSVFQAAFKGSRTGTRAFSAAVVILHRAAAMLCARRALLVSLLRGRVP